MSHGCMIEFYELRCCITLKNAIGKTLGGACFIDDVGVGCHNVVSYLRYERYVPPFGWDVAPPLEDDSPIEYDIDTYALEENFASCVHK